MITFSVMAFIKAIAFVLLVASLVDLFAVDNKQIVQSEIGNLLEVIVFIVSLIVLLT